MWAIIKAIFAYIVCRILSAVGIFLVLVAAGRQTQETLVSMAITMDGWSFWASLAVALYVLCKSW